MSSGETTPAGNAGRGQENAMVTRAGKKMLRIKIISMGAAETGKVTLEQQLTVSPYNYNYNGIIIFVDFTILLTLRMHLELTCNAFCNFLC